MKKLVFNTPKGARRGHMIFSQNHKKSVKSKEKPGSVAERFPVVLDGGKTIVWITDRSKEREIRERYAS
ncbi:MAG TPA: hypothetical protein PKG48_06690 [Bacteroidales bacterium]|nr:hypothetical protein [Bacteroidales bacterium]HPS63342.1 hypothetical protein [Bacteroidales bacterium]